MKTGDTTFQVPRLDIATHTLQTIDYSHHEIHAGSHFNHAEIVDLAINTVRDIRFITPNTTKWCHLTFSVTCEAKTDFCLYEGATTITAGTGITLFNNDRNSATTSTCTANYIDNGSLADANADTMVTTCIDHVIIGSGRTAGFIDREQEIILKQNTTYCFRFIANTAGYVNYRIQFYEHTNKTA